MGTMLSIDFDPVCMTIEICEFNGVIVVFEPVIDALLVGREIEAWRNNELPDEEW